MSTTQNFINSLSEDELVNQLLLGDASNTKAHRADFGDLLGHRFAGALARELKEAKRRNLTKSGSCAVALKAGREVIHHALLRGGIFHVDEVTNNDSAHVTQS